MGARQQKDDLRRDPIENEQDENANGKSRGKCSEERMGILFEMPGHRQIVPNIRYQDCQLRARRVGSIS